MMCFLAEHPGHFEQLTESPALIRTAIEEFLRFVTPIQLLARNTTREVKLDRHPNKHLAFGAGTHLCVGAHLPRLELTVALETLIRTVSSLRIDPDRSITWKARGDVRALGSVPVLVRRR